MLRPPRLLLAASALLVGAISGCDRAPLADAAARFGTDVVGEAFSGSLGQPDARFFSSLLPDERCTRATITLRFRPDELDLRCDVADGILQVSYRDEGPMDARQADRRITAQSASGFRFEGLLGAAETELDGTLRNPAGQTLAVTLRRR